MRHVCPVCGAKLGKPGVAGGRRKVYCSDACRVAAYRQRETRKRESQIRLLPRLWRPRAQETSLAEPREERRGAS
jgi:hypothetical protein